jgi:hypothetical protein
LTFVSFSCRERAVLLLLLLLLLLLSLPLLRL